MGTRKSSERSSRGRQPSPASRKRVDAASVKRKAKAADDVPMICGSKDVPGEHRRLYLEVVSLTDEFCHEHLDQEYQDLCREMAIAACQDGTPLVRGKIAGWACGIVYAVGWVNYLTDPGQTPHVRAEEIATWFGVSPATMHQKFRVLRDGLGLAPWDPDFSRESTIAAHPLRWIVEVNGFLVDLRTAPRGLQEAALEAGLIPFLPDENTEDGG